MVSGLYRPSNMTTFFSSKLLAQDLHVINFIYPNEEKYAGSKNVQSKTEKNTHTHQHF